MHLKAHQQQELQKICMKNQERNQRNWPAKWSWLMDEYKVMNDQLAVTTDKSYMLQRKIKVDFRSIRPIPEQTNHFYGWLANKPEFKLELYGADVQTPPKIQEFCSLG